MYVLYTDDSILEGPDPKEIDNIIAQMYKIKLGIAVEGTLEGFLVVNINMKQVQQIYSTQPHLIESILEDLSLDYKESKTRSTPTYSSRIIKRY